MKKIELNIDNKKIICIKKSANKGINMNTKILLAGAATQHLDYYALAYFLKSDLVIINNPEHGTKKTKSSGPALTKAEDMIKLHIKIIKELIKRGYATLKVDVIGYSMGGLSLLNILKSDELRDVIDHAIILCSDFCVKDTALELCKDLYNSKRGVFNIKKMFDYALTKNSPAFIRFLPLKFFSANDEACNADILTCIDFNKLAERKIIDKKIDTKVIFIIGENDFFFDEKKTIQDMSNRFEKCTLIKTCNSHMLPIEAPMKTAHLIEHALEC